MSEVAPAPRIVGFKNGLHLNADLAAKSSWTVQDIQARTGALVKEAMKLFAI